MYIHPTSILHACRCRPSCCNIHQILDCIISHFIPLCWYIRPSMTVCVHRVTFYLTYIIHTYYLVDTYIRTPHPRSSFRVAYLHSSFVHTYIHHLCHCIRKCMSSCLYIIHTHRQTYEHASILHIFPCVYILVLSFILSHMHLQTQRIHILPHPRTYPGTHPHTY